MEIEKLAQILILLHASFGAVALFCGGIALITKKGDNLHKKSGKLFYYAMLISAILAFVVSILPNHESPFLFSIGIFSIYFLISGYRSLRYKEVGFQFLPDKIIAYLIILTGLFMITYPMILDGKLNIVLAVFGLVGLVFGFRDISLFKDIHRVKRNWLKLHLGKMTGGYIAAVSAFFVVNQILPGIWNWFVPGIIGTVYITYWINKLNGEKKL